MNVDQDELQEDLLATRRELEETKYRLLLFENSRTARMIRYIREFLQNPIKGVRNIGRFLDALRTTETSKPMPNSSNKLRSIPLRIHSNNPLLRYPHMKVACLGTIDQVAEVCHAFELGDNNWVNLVERGVDFLLLDEVALQKKQANYKKQLADANARNIPVVVIRTSTETMSEAIPKDALIIEQSLAKSGDVQDFPYIDIHTHNPININFLPSKIVACYGVGDALVAPHLVNIKNVPVGDRPAAIVVADPEKSLDTYAKLTAMLERAAAGVPVLLAGKLRIPHPFTTCANWQEAKKLALDILEQPTLWEQHSIRQRRQVVLQHSQLNRFEAILKLLDLPVEPLPKISAIASTKRPKEIKNIIKNFSSQNYQNKELILLLHGDGFNTKEIRTKLKESGVDYTIIERGAETLFGHNLNIALDAATGDYITKMDDDDYYGAEHYNDLLAATYYSRADLVGKWSNWIYMKNKNRTTTWMIEKQESYTHHLPGGTFLAEKAFLKKVRFGHVRQGIDSELYRRAEARGGTLYSTHRYNYVRVRHGDHTYVASDEKFLAHCTAPEFSGYDVSKTMV